MPYADNRVSTDKCKDTTIKDTTKTNDETKGKDKKSNGKEMELNKTKLKKLLEVQKSKISALRKDPRPYSKCFLGVCLMGESVKERITAHHPNKQTNRYSRLAA